MRRIFALILACMLGVEAMLVVSLSEVEASEASVPTCVMLKFINKTRFQKLEPEAKLSDLVVEKLVASGRFRLKETRPIDQDAEAQLYDINQRYAEAIAETGEGNFDGLFEGKEADVLQDARMGQKISPELTAAIGKAHGAEYLIQGSIIGLSRGTERDGKFDLVAGIAGMIAGQFGDTGRAVGNIARDSKKTYTGTTMKNDLRIIKADTGEVVWHKEILCASKQDKVKVGDISAGSDQLNMNLYELALEQAAQKIVDELIADMDKGELFGGI